MNGNEKNQSLWERYNIRNILVIILCLAILYFGFTRGQELFALLVVTILILGFSARFGQKAEVKEKIKVTGFVALHKALPFGDYYFYFVLFSIFVFGFMRGMELLSLLVIVIMYSINYRARAPENISSNRVFITLLLTFLVFLYGFVRRQEFTAMFVAGIIYFLLPSLQKYEEVR